MDVHFVEQVIIQVWISTHFGEQASVLTIDTNPPPVCTRCGTSTPAPSPLPAPLAAETLNLERTLSDIISQAHGLTPAEIELEKGFVRMSCLCGTRLPL